MNKTTCQKNVHPPARFHAISTVGYLAPPWPGNALRLENTLLGGVIILGHPEE
jgi:hypothetical protein